MFFLLSNIAVFIILATLLYILFMVWPPDSPWAPWWQMPEVVCKKSAEYAKVNKEDIIYDLGCGTGKALVMANKLFGAKGVGIEIDTIRSLIAKWNIWKSKATGIKIIKDNFYNVNISDATVLYFYLVPNALKRLTRKLLRELKPGVRIVSYIYSLPDTYKGKVKLIKHDKSLKIFVYELLKT